EYLKDDATYWPSGANYSTLFTSTEDQRYITNFYQQTGEWLALACTFSLADLHLQNVRVRAYQPHLIDLEVSLGDYIAEVKSTLLLDPPNNVYGGINGYELKNLKYKYISKPGRSHEVLEQAFIRETFQNRLYVLRPARHLVEIEPVSLLRGLSDGL